MQVATLDSVVVYDTLCTLPLAVLGHLHYDSITDLAWSSDGQYLAVSSRDCYCRWVPAGPHPAHLPAFFLQAFVGGLSSTAYSSSRCAAAAAVRCRCLHLYAC